MKEIPFSELGTYAASLDELRNELDCHIYADHEMSALIVAAPDYDIVTHALKHLQTVLEGCVSWHNSRSRWFLVEPPSKGHLFEATVVKMIEASNSYAADLGHVPRTYVERIPTLQVREEVNEKGEDASLTAARNLYTLKYETAMCLSQLEKFHGAVRMQIVLGILVFNRYKWSGNSPFQPTQPFIDTLQEESTQGRLYRMYVLTLHLHCAYFLLRIMC